MKLQEQQADAVKQMLKKQNDLINQPGGSIVPKDLSLMTGTYYNPAYDALTITLDGDQLYIR